MNNQETTRADRLTGRNRNKLMLSPLGLLVAVLLWWRKNCKKLSLAGFALVLVAGSAFALSVIDNVQGTIESFSFPEFPQLNGPATAEMVGLTLKPGDVIPWHYHQGPAYVIVQHGTLTEDDGCGQVRQFGPGAAFSEEPGHIHQVSNQGNRAVVIYFTAVYPVNSQDAIFVDGPDCH